MTSPNRRTIAGMLLAGASLALAGCAATRSDDARTSTASAASPRVGGEAADARVELTRAAAGFRRVTRDGRELYCRRDAPLGSRVAQEYCLTEEQLLRRYRRAQDVRDDMRRPQVCQGTCTTGG